MPGSFILPIVLGLPLLGAIFVMCTPKTESTLHRGIGLVFTVLTFLTSLPTSSTMPQYSWPIGVGPVIGSTPR